MSPIRIARLTVLTAALLLAAAPGAQAASVRCSASPPPTTKAYQKLAGIPANLQSLDLYPRRAACRAGRPSLPVVMWVHGGGYSVGDKANQMKDKIAWSVREGYLLVSVNYRLTRPGEPGSAQYPDHYRDVAAAVGWIRANVGRYGGDRTRIALLGHSAGADIVSNVATNPAWLAERDLPPSALRCSGPLDTEGFDKVRSAEPGGGEKAQWKNALGNLPTYLNDTSASLRIARGLGIRPTITVVRGSALRRSIEQAFADRLRGIDVPATVIDARNLSHEQVNTQIGMRSDRVMTPPLTRFLDSCFTQGAARRR